MSFAGKMMAVLGLDTKGFDKNLKGSQSRAQQWGKSFAKMGAGVSVASAGIVLALRQQVNAADQIGKDAQKIGVTTEALGGLRHAAEQSGASAQDLDMSMAKLGKRMADAVGGNKEAAALFDRLGISVTDASGGLRSADAVFADVAESLSKMPDGAEKTALAMKLFEEAGLKLIPMLNAGKKGLQDYIAEARDLGILIDDKTAASAAAFNDNLDRLAKTMRGIAIQAMAALAPVLDRISAAAVEASKWFRGLSPTMQSVIAGVAGVTAVAGPLAVALGAVMLAVAPLGAALAALASPFALVVGGAAAVAAAGIYLYNNWQIVADRMGELGDQISAAMGRIISRIAELRAEFPLLNQAVETAGGFLARFKDAANGLALELGTPVALALRGIISLFRGEYRAATEDAISVSDRLANALVRITMKVTEVSQKIGEPLVEALRQSMAQAKAVLDAGWAAIKGSLSKWVPDFVELGEQVVNGLLVGLRAGWDKVSGAVQSLGDKVKGAFKDALKIRSPSKVFTEFGQFITQGLTKGIAEGAPLAVDGIKSLADQITGTGKGTLADGLQGFYNTSKSGFTGMLTGVTSVRDGVSQLASSLASMFAERAFVGLFGGGPGSGSGGLFGSLFGGLFGGGAAAIPANAKGTNFFPGGLTRVNELGGEIMNLPRGTQIIPHDISKRMADKSGAGGALAVSIGFDQSTGGLTAMVRDEAGRVVARAAPQIVQDSVRATYETAREVPIR